MGKQYNPKFTVCTSLFCFLAFSATILAQNPSKGASAARDATRNRGRATTQRQAPPTALVSLERRSALNLTPIVIYYSRDGAEVAPKTSPNVEKRTDGIGESITIYYGSKKPSTEPVPRPGDERLANNVSKQSPPQTKDSSNALSSAATAVNSRARRLVAPAVDHATSGSAPTSAQPESPTNEKPVDEIPVDPKPSVTEPAAVVESPSAKTEENAKAESKADPASARPSVNPGADPKVATESEAKPPPPPASNPATDSNLAAETVPPPPVSNPSTDTAANAKPATETSSPNSTETKPATETASPAVPNAAGEMKPTVGTAGPPALSSAETVALNNKAVELTRERRYEEASDMLRRAIQVEPDTFKFHRNLSIVYEQMNKLGEALESAKTAVQLAPREPSALVQLCGVQLQLKEHRQALNCYENLSKITPLDPMAQTFYGVALLGSGRVLDSLTVLEKAAAAAPSSSVTLNALGFVYFNERRFGDAVSTFKKAVELAPDQHEVRLNLGIAYLANGNKEGALSQYRVLKMENPKLAEQLYLLLFRDKVVTVDELKRH